ncbi:hypothetical protein NPS70_16225 [Streptomyces sp. C10-9-1]|uniref:hypothetical protein n=1 Tax=Streptomyces sp. C10-9-1 TaxID=1859285 RepID=UPI0021133FCB|nr:hypothetical protein [Streptomyces sp. C10-9-1]MCQ6554733.1 hypothetical protein [Streptomyces sp. C10-9-1]
MSLPTGIRHTLTVPPSQILAGDVFTRHRREHTARFNAQRAGLGSVVVETQTGTVWFNTAGDPVTVSRIVREVPCVGTV